MVVLKGKNIKTSREAFLQGCNTGRTGIKAATGKRLFVTHIDGTNSFFEISLLLFESNEIVDNYEEVTGIEKGTW